MIDLSYYAIVGLSRNATDLEISAAYEKKISDLKANKLQRIKLSIMGFDEMTLVNMRNVLLDPAMRRRHDDSIRSRSADWTLCPPIA